MGNTLFKNTQGYGYKYTDISEIHKWLEENGIEYYQYIEPIEGNDYIYTVPIIDGEELNPRRGCRVITATLGGKTNPAQEQGSGITYARRYSLLMAFGLATTDDDAACMTRDKAPEKPTGFPDRKKLIEIAERHYPEGETRTKTLLKNWEAEAIKDLTDDQLKAIYGKFGGK